MQCQNQYTSDGCHEPYYTVTYQGVKLNGGRKFATDGSDYVNFQYIPCNQYKGVGSHRNHNGQQWTEIGGSLKFEVLK